MMTANFFLDFKVLLLVISVVSVSGKKKEGYGTVIGIDLGTTYSCVGAFVDGRIEIIPNDQGNRITPSYVSFTQEGIRLIGDAAKNQLTTNPYNTIYDAKRLIGRKWSDASLQNDIKHFPFQVIDHDSKPHILVSAKKGKLTRFTPQEISAMVLGKMKETAEMYLNTNVTHAVVTVPAYFNDAQRQATKDAATIAGLTVIRVINEPTAAAIAYGVKRRGAPQNILVYDLGGGTFDVSVLVVDNGVFQVLTTDGNTHLGGEDFEQNVVNYFVELYKTKTGVDVSGNSRTLQKLKREVERAKRRLSTDLQCRIEVDDFFEGKNFGETLTRAKFEELNIDLFRSTIKLVQKVLDDADLTKKEIDEYILVGGSTRIPKIRKLVEEFFNGKEPTVGINPDEAVAYGAVLQAGVLAGYKESRDMVLMDINPFTLGIEKQGKVMAKIIPKNSVLPVEKSEMFTTADDNQESVEIKVYEGERAATKDNHFLGRFDLKGIRPAPRGDPEIKVTFNVDNNGILKVTAKDMQRKDGVNSIVINNDHSRLTSDEIKRMMKNQERFAEEDKKIYKKNEAYNDFEKFLYNFKKKAADIMNSGKLSYEEEKKLEKAIDVTVEWVDSHTFEEVATYQRYRKDFEELIGPFVAKAAPKQNKEEL